MNQYVTGAVIRELRDRKNITQAELAGRLNVSDKTVSKWETGKGYPDITLLEPIADVFGISLSELLSGNPVQNRNRAANLKRSSFYVCPLCGNLIWSVGEAVVHCHGMQLSPLEEEPADEKHPGRISRVEDEYFFQIEHEMTKQHFISFAAAVSTNGIRTVKFYPEWNAEARFPVRGTEKILFFCNRDGLFSLPVPKR